MKIFGTCPRCGGWGALWEVELMRRRFWLFGRLVPHTALRCDECGEQP